MPSWPQACCCLCFAELRQCRGQPFRRKPPAMKSKQDDSYSKRHVCTEANKSSFMHLALANSDVMVASCLCEGSMFERFED
ncbi:hypothetical protein SETIT_2G141800v2 [Setaria italica]|uniref:Uncharacterized protein n=1 Tax=Setaria italica TaxID=4555 RepID=A0A368Q0W3_SETIT|nr:hypothetical protein SETIT_2G141800v2 [Setaria italica]